MERTPMMVRASLTIIALLLLPIPAQGHMLSTGVGPFYDGFTHLYVTPADILIVMSIAIIGGMGGAGRARAVLLAALPGWASGITFGALFIGAEWRPSTVFSVLVIIGGIVAALDQKLTRGVLATSSLLLGVVLGCSAGSGLQRSAYLFETALGMFAGVAVAISLLVAMAHSRPNNWQRIALRVLGSWIAAIGMLTFAWELQQLT